MPITLLEFAEMQARLNMKSGCHSNGKPVEHEIGKGGLHDQILNYCKSKGWLAIHSRTDRRSTNAVGTPDFLIFADNARVFAFEAKSKNSKPTPTQLATLHWLSSLGHTTGVVYNLGQVIAIIEET